MSSGDAPQLSLSGLPAGSFSDLALSALPPGLQSLRLGMLPNNNDKGLRRFATSRLASTIKVLSLVAIDITDLVTLFKMLSVQLTNSQSADFSYTDSKPESSATSLRNIRWEICSDAGPSLARPLPPTSNALEEQQFLFSVHECTTDKLFCHCLLATGISI
jgi:hypothetical protein